MYKLFLKANYKCVSKSCVFYCVTFRGYVTKSSGQYPWTYCTVHQQRKVCV